MGFFEKLKQGLSKTASSISSVFTASELDDEFYDDLEESLIVSDLGMDTTEAVMDRLRQTAKEQRIKTVDEAKLALRGILADMLNVGDPALKLDTKPSVILVIGVNGVGKTTTIGKLAHQLHDQGKKVLLCAGDTFRAAAADQLEIWSERAHCDIIRQHEGADPASVVFDAIAAARARGSDVIICDTAGRLHNKQNLMNELNKISRILDRELPGASRRSCSSSTARPARTACFRPGSSRSARALPAWFSRSWTARPRAAWSLRSRRRCISRSSSSASASRSTI